MRIIMTNNKWVRKLVMGVLPFYLFTFLPLNAQVKLPQFFGDNMVLQQQSECNIWGKADANKMVRILTTWDNKTYQVKSDGKGDFEVKVKTPKAGGPYEICITESSAVILRNVMIGEVWICSGQSNM